MNVDTWLLYVGTVLLLMSTPGPSHLLMLSVSLSNGFERSLATAAGDLTANALQILLAGLGLAAVITQSRYGFAIIKWAGVAYLVWVGVRHIIASFNATSVSGRAPVTSLKRLWLRGFVTSAANPKAVVFFAALFPQFLDPAYPLGPQIAILGLSYIIIDGSFLATYGKGASWISGQIRGRHRAWVDRAAGTSLIAAAVLLGLRTNER
ncbi:MAG: LysE family transporter [Gammaproteobacteria bacterium]|nr:LysE family transporter [Gammaproteobacteria bacterium]